MPNLQVTCTLKSGTTHESITHLGGEEGGGWLWAKEHVITAIEAKTHSFYTFENGRRAIVGIVDGPPKHLRTHVNGEWTNHLLALPNCPN